MIQLYHGSDTFIEVPDLNKCKPFKDFGKGFYLSADRKQAESLAVQRCRQTLKDVPVVNEFLFDDLGPIADDSVTFQLRRFQRGVIRTIDELISELRYDKGITFQYYFGTPRALKKLVKL